MKQYLLFLCEEFEEKGGWYDYHDSFNTIEEAKAVADEACKDISSRVNAHIVDLTILKIVWTLNRHKTGHYWHEWEYRWTQEQ